MYITRIFWKPQCSWALKVYHTPCQSPGWIVEQKYINFFVIESYLASFAPWIRFRQYWSLAPGMVFPSNSNSLAIERWRNRVPKAMLDHEPHKKTYFFGGRPLFAGKESMGQTALKCPLESKCTRIQCLFVESSQGFLDDFSFFWDKIVYPEACTWQKLLVNTQEPASLRTCHAAKKSTTYHIYGNPRHSSTPPGMVLEVLKSRRPWSPWFFQPFLVRFSFNFELLFQKSTT